jgi:TIR domain
MPDVFISYAHRDNRTPRYEPRGWVECFYLQLKDRLDAIRGADTSVFRDESEGRITGSSILTDTIRDALAECGVFIAVLSPAYFASDWCRRELDYFREAATAHGGLRVGNKSRIIKVVKLPSDTDAGSGVAPPPEMADATGFTFWRADERGRPAEFNAPYGNDLGVDFSRAINDLAYDIAELLKKRAAAPVEIVRPVPATGISLYLAETTWDVKEKRDDLRREFEQFGYTVLPAADLGYGPDYGQRVAADIAQARLSVHLIGQSYGVRPEQSENSVVELQYDAAGEEQARRPAFRRIVWLPPGLVVAEERQRTFVAELQNDPELIVAPLEDLKRVIHTALALPAEKPADGPAGAGTKSVYLIVDAPDGAAAQPVDDWLFKQGFDVRRSSSSADKTESRRLHTMHLKNSDGVLIYHGTTLESWLFSKLNELEKVYGQGRSRKRPMPRAVILADPKRPDKDLFRMHRIMTVPGFGGFSPTELQDFVEALKTPDAE